MRLFKQEELQIFFIVSSSEHKMKLPRSKIFSYFRENASNILLTISRSFLILLLWDLHEQFMSHFFLYSIVSTKKLSVEGKLWFKPLAGISSLKYNIVPLIQQDSTSGNIIPLDTTLFSLFYMINEKNCIAKVLLTNLADIFRWKNRSSGPGR